MTFSIVKFIGLLGLCFDVIGAWYISRGLIRKTVEVLKHETGFSFGPNDNYIISGYTQKIESNVGFIFLLLGFTLQGLSSIITKSSLVSSLSNAEGLLGLVLLFIAVTTFNIIANTVVKVNKKKFINIYVKGILIEHIDNSGDKPKSVLDSKRLLRYLDISCEDNISIEDAWNMLKKNVL